MKKRFKFIDLFAGIGGFHLAMKSLGGECVFASEIDKYARITYEHNHKFPSSKNELFNEDIRSINPFEIPNFDILCAGFPCQPFSQAGLRKGFADNYKSERGNLFFNIVEILEVKKPKAFFLENVRGLLNHDKGRTFNIIRDVIESELRYSFYYKIIRASDYGLPQLRPRIFIVGFRDEGFIKDFNFPAPTPLEFNMSDIFGGKCSREIGYTIRVGGRGSGINDRRNWDNYLVDGKERRLSYFEAKKMQGFPEDFEFPVSPTQAMKQLGNSVAINAIKAVGENILSYLENLNENKLNVKSTKNKGEWSELLVFIKLLLDKKLFLSNEDLSSNNNFFKINKITTQNIDTEFLISELSNIVVKNKNSNIEKTINISEILNTEVLNKLMGEIKNNSQTFDIPDFKVIQNSLGFDLIKGGNSNQKADILLDIENDFFQKENEGFGIKSYLGNKPTLLNASGNTNFIFKIKGLDRKNIDEINEIETSTKLKDRILRIEKLGGSFEYLGAEKDTMQYNLKMVDSDMLNIIGKVLICFYKDRISSLERIVEILTDNIEEKALLENKIKNLLTAILLGFFAGTKWNGSYQANGTIILKNNGECLGFHIIELDNLKNFLFKNIKLDTPSTTRHRFGKLYVEKDGNIYFKLNLQLRF